jgi:hypothetical protein
VTAPGSYDADRRVDIKKGGDRAEVLSGGVVRDVARRPDGFWVVIPEIDTSVGGVWSPVRVPMPLTDEVIRDGFDGVLSRLPMYRSVEAAIWSLIGDPQ